MRARRGSGWLHRKGGRKEGEGLPRKKSREHSGKSRDGGDTTGPGAWADHRRERFCSSVLS